MNLEVEKNTGGDLVLTGIPAILSFALMELPRLLGDDAPGLRGRFERTPYEDDETGTEEWQRNAAPELWRLFAEAREIVLDDLRGMKQAKPGKEGHDLTIPAASLPAWLSALAAARVALGEHHEVTPDDLGDDLPVPFRSERDRGVFLIQMLGWMQAILIEVGDAEG